MRPFYARPRFPVSSMLLVLALCTLAVSVPDPARGQASKGPAGELRWGLHVTLAARWLDPAGAFPDSDTRRRSRISG
jgi:hypothetical protein